MEMVFNWGWCLLSGNPQCLLSGHLWCYAFHGPPIQDWGGPWFSCARCGCTGRPRDLRGDRVVVDKNDQEHGHI